MSNGLDELEDQMNEVLRRKKILDKTLGFYDAVNPFHKEYPPFLRDMLLAVEENLPRLEDWVYDSCEDLEEMLR